jgi:hypothetical protein
MSNAQLNHECVLCGKKYHACDSCFQIKTYTPWRTVCDTFNHYLIWGAIRSYKTGILSKEQARDELVAQGVREGEFSDYLPTIAITLEEIFTAPKLTKSKKKSNEFNAEVNESDGDIATNSDEEQARLNLA